MDSKSIRSEARKKLIEYCRVCSVCDGRICAGEVPGMGGIGTGASFMENIRALATVKLNLSAVHDVLSPDTTGSFFGQKLETPIMIAPMVCTPGNVGTGLTEIEMITALMKGAHLAGSLGWLGGRPEWVDPMRNDGGSVVIIKPHLDHDKIYKAFTKAEQNGAVAVGIDVDGAGLITMKLQGQPVGPKTMKQLVELSQASKLPFIVKGIMTVADAVKCAEAGVGAIVVSNHGGRVLDHTCGTADTLPLIAKELKGKITILVDGGVRSGVDALKMLALGADGVLIGRPLIAGACGGGAEGVAFLINRYTTELYTAMILTGCANLQQIGPEILFGSLPSL